MSTQAPAASARPDIISLDVLLNDVDEGRIQIPRFQRQYVWTPQMMRELFDSVLNGYPIGSLLFWTPRELNVRMMPNIGPIPARTPPQKSQISLVLDGHQRLATLYGVLRLPENHIKSENAAADKLGWWLGYDLEAMETRQMRRPDDFENPSVLPLRAVLNTTDFVRFARLIDGSFALTDAQKAEYLNRADAVQRAVRDYRIALTTMRDGTVNDAVAIFSRINRSGKRMTTDQMAVALTYEDGFNLEEALDEILGSLSKFGFGDVSRTIVLQSLLNQAGQNFAKPKFDELRKRDIQQKLQAATTPATAALCEAADFLNNVIGFSTGRLLPYALQILLLAVFFSEKKIRSNELGEELKSILLRWFWATSFSGWFASASSTEVERAVETMTNFARSNELKSGRVQFETFFLDRPLRPFPKTFDRRSARIRAMLLVEMIRGQLLDPVTNEPLNGSELMADRDRNDLPYVFPTDGTKTARSPANRILLDRTYGSSVRGVLTDCLQNVIALETHGIDANARLAIRERNLLDFVEARERQLVNQEAQFLERFQLEIGEKTERSDEELDVDEA
jgi:hypothetical protein